MGSKKKKCPKTSIGHFRLKIHNKNLKWLILSYISKRGISVASSTP